MKNNQQPQVNVNVNSLIPRQGVEQRGKLKPVDRQTVFDVPPGLDGALAWLLSWICIGGLFVALSRVLLMLDFPPIVAPVIAGCFALWLLIECFKQPRAEIGLALGLVLVGLLLGVWE